MSGPALVASADASPAEQPRAILDEALRLTGR